MHVLIKGVAEEGTVSPYQAYVRYGARPSRTDTGQALDCLSMGQKCADQGCTMIRSLRGWGGSGELNEVYLTAVNIGFLQKANRNNVVCCVF